MGTFSEAGPTHKQIDSASFCSELYGEGYSPAILEKYENDPSKIPPTLAPDISVKATVSGPDAAYRGTAIMVVESAICLLEELDIIREGLRLFFSFFFFLSFFGIICCAFSGDLKHGIPAIVGGVFTPSTVFSGTSLMRERLHGHGILFEVKEQKVANAWKGEKAPKEVEEAKEERVGVVRSVEEVEEENEVDTEQKEEDDGVATELEEEDEDEEWVET